MINARLNFAVTPIRDEEALKEARALVSAILDEPLYIRKGWIRQTGWSAVPLLLERESPETQMTRIFGAAIAIGVSRCFAIMTSDWSEPGGLERAYEVPMTLEGLRSFYGEKLSLEYALVPKDQSFAIAYSDEVYVAAGPPQFVRDVAGGSIPPVTAFAADSEDLRKVSAHANNYLTRIANYYAGLQKTGN